MYLAGVEHAAGIYAATELAVDQEITGPAVIEQPDGAVVVPPGAVAHTDVYGNVHLRTLESI